MANDNDVLVIAYYADAAAAEAAAEELKNWDKADEDIKLGAIGVITLDEDSGQLQVDEIGQRNTKSGALWGTAIGAGLGLITGGIGLIPGMALGAALGGGAGALDHMSLGMSDADVRVLTENLQNSGAALGVMCDDFEVAATEAKLVVGGGTTTFYNVPGGTAEALAAAAVAQAEASAAVDASVTGEVDGLGVVAAVTGVTAEEATRLGDAGVEKASSLLEMGATPQGRAELAAATGIDEETILKGVKKMDLMRIDGVGVVYADLLHSAGVETVPDLARRNSANLTAKMVEVNEIANIAEELPGEDEVADWVNQAKDLPRMIEY